MRFSLTFRTLPAALFGASMLIAASPASAQTEATAAAQIGGEVQKLSEGVNSPLGKGDEEFSQLFASWQSLDSGNGMAAAARPEVSVPSRMPVKQVALTSGYGMRTHPILRRRAAHKGVDLAAPRGTPVYATADGIITRADRFGSYGNYIQIEHGGELQTRFAHLSGFEVVAGDRVEKGELIGYVGSTGRSTGPHLHYEVRIAGEAVNPIPYMTGEIELADLELIESEGAKGGPE